MKKFFYLSIFLILILTGCGKAGQENSTEAQPEPEKIEISLEEAITIGRVEADKIYDDLFLTEVHSYDNDQFLDENAGSDGKREWWYVNFANEKLNYVSVLISGGKVINVEHFDENGNLGLIDLGDIKLTSEDAVKKAKEIGLKGGDPQENWVSGYNFKLSYASLMDSPDDMRLFFEVIGISPEGYFAHVDFDAATGELLLAQEEVEFEDGTVIWQNF